MIKNYDLFIAKNVGRTSYVLVLKCSLEPVCPVSIEENQGKPQLGHQVTAFIAVDKL
jgi:hypothetical protein